MVKTDATGKASLEKNGRASLTIGKTGYFDTTVDFFVSDDTSKTVRLIPKSIDDDDLHLFLLDEEGKYQTGTCYISIDDPYEQIVDGEIFTGELKVSNLVQGTTYNITVTNNDDSTGGIYEYYTHKTDDNVLVGKSWTGKTFNKTTLKVLNSDNTPFVGKVFYYSGFGYYLTDDKGEFDYTKSSTQYIIDGTGQISTETVDIANNNYERLFILDDNGLHQFNFRFLTDGEVYEYKLKDNEPLTTMTVYDSSTVTDDGGVRDYSNAVPVPNVEVKIGESIFTTDANGQIKMKATPNQEELRLSINSQEYGIYVINGEFVERIYDSNNNIHYYPPIIMVKDKDLQNPLI